MEERVVLQRLKRFALAEIREKGGGEAIIYRAPSTLIMRRDRTPGMMVRGISGAKYFVYMRRGKSQRLYFFGSSGEMLGAEDLIEEPEFLRSSTTLLKLR
ncbi:MAG: hypothetical protein ACK4GQ_01860 [Candidatus Hadarchaeales archaeon]